MAPIKRRQLTLGCVALLLGACAHQPAAPPKREPIVMPVPPAASEMPIAPSDTGAVVGATPT